MTEITYKSWISRDSDIIIICQLYELLVVEVYLGRN